MQGYIDGSELVDVEYVGDPDPLDEVTKLRIAMGEIVPQAAAVLRGAAMMRSQAIPGVCKRICDPEYFPGLSRQYVFGPAPETFVQKVTKPDWDVLRGSGSGHQFERVGDPMNELILPRHGEDVLRFVNDIEMTPSAVNESLRAQAAANIR